MRALQTPSRRRCGLARAGAPPCATALSSSPPVVARSSRHAGLRVPRRLTTTCSLTTTATTTTASRRARACELAPTHRDPLHTRAAARRPTNPTAPRHVARADVARLTAADRATDTTARRRTRRTPRDARPPEAATETSGNRHQKQRDQSPAGLLRTQYVAPRVRRANRDVRP